MTRAGACGAGLEGLERLVGLEAAFGCVFVVVRAPFAGFADLEGDVREAILVLRREA